MKRDVKKQQTPGGLLSDPVQYKIIEFQYFVYRKHSAQFSIATYESMIRDAMCLKPGDKISVRNVEQTWRMTLYGVHSPVIDEINARRQRMCGTPGYSEGLRFEKEVSVLFPNWKHVSGRHLPRVAESYVQGKQRGHGFGVMY